MLAVSCRDPAVDLNFVPISNYCIFKLFLNCVIEAYMYYCIILYVRTYIRQDFWALEQMMFGDR